MKKTAVIKTVIFVILFAVTLSLSYLSPWKKAAYSEMKEDGYMILKNIYCGSNSRNVYDLAIPDNRKSDGLLLFIHGGAWVTGSKDDYLSAVTDYAGKGYISAAISYRYASEYTTCEDILDDIDAALKSIKEELAKRNIDCGKTILLGGSAGAHLSLMYSYSRADTAPVKPVAAVSYSAPANLNDPGYYSGTEYSGTFCEWFGYLIGKRFSVKTAGSVKDRLAAVSPVSYVNGNTVPTIICQGTDDELIPFANAADLDRLLTDCGVTHEFFVFRNSGHGLENDPETMELADKAVLKYINDYLN